MQQRLGSLEASVVVLATDHRRLMVRFAAPAFEIVDHMPRESDGSGLRALVMMVDANGRLGSVQSIAVGCENSFPENGKGARLHSCVRALQMFAPATFFEFAQWLVAQN